MNKFQSRYEVLTPNGWMDFDGVKKTSSSSTVEIGTGRGNKLTCTSNHRISTDVGFVWAQELKVGDVIHTEHGKETVASIIHGDTRIDVYDLLDVKGGNVYFTNGIVSHNCEFLGSSGTLIAGHKLKELSPFTPVAQSGGLYQYERPILDHTYAIIVDVSRGKGLDYSAFSVIDITKMPYKQVCTYRDNMIGSIDYSTMIHNVAKLYNNAYLLVEINDIGGQVSDILYLDYGYENMVFTENAGRTGKRVSGGFGKNVDRGIRTTKSVKSVGCSVLKMLIEQNQFIVTDFNTIQELSRFSRKGVSYEAESGATDDLVMGLVLFAWLSDQTYFRDLTDINTMAALREKTEEEIEDDLLPFGFINNGIEDEEPVYMSTNSWMNDY